MATFLDSNYFDPNIDFSLTRALPAGTYMLALGVWVNMSFAENNPDAVPSLGDGFTALVTRRVWARTTTSWRCPPTTGRSRTRCRPVTWAAPRRRSRPVCCSRPLGRWACSPGDAGARGEARRFVRVLGRPRRWALDRRGRFPAAIVRGGVTWILA